MYNSCIRQKVFSTIKAFPEPFCIYCCASPFATLGVFQYCVRGLPFCFSVQFSLRNVVELLSYFSNGLLCRVTQEFVQRFTIYIIYINICFVKQICGQSTSTPLGSMFNHWRTNQALWLTTLNNESKWQILKIIILTVKKLTYWIILTTDFM